MSESSEMAGAADRAAERLRARGGDPVIISSAQRETHQYGQGHPGPNDHAEEHSQDAGADGAPSSNLLSSWPGQGNATPDSQPRAGHPPMVVDTPITPGAYAHSVTVSRPQNTDNEAPEKRSAGEILRQDWDDLKEIPGAVAAITKWAIDAAKRVADLPIVDKIDGGIGRLVNMIPGVHMEEYDPP